MHTVPKTVQALRTESERTKTQMERCRSLGKVSGSPLQQTWLLTCTGLVYQLQ